MKGGLVILKVARKMLRKILLTTSIDQYEVEDHDHILDGNLPEDVTEGHFAVYAVEGGELRRLVIDLRYLSHPGFQRLLEQAEEEFGFAQIGVLAIPCSYSDLQRVVGSKGES